VDEAGPVSDRDWWGRKFVQDFHRRGNGRIHVFPGRSELDTSRHFTQIVNYVLSATLSLRELVAKIWLTGRKQP